MKLTQKDRKIIQELSKTSYDAWIIPPPMEEIEHIFNPVLIADEINFLH